MHEERASMSGAVTALCEFGSGPALIRVLQQTQQRCGAHPHNKAQSPRFINAAHFCGTAHHVKKCASPLQGETGTREMTCENIIKFSIFATLQTLQITPARVISRAAIREDGGSPVLLERITGHEITALLT
jgi:hypothetical protein